MITFHSPKSLLYYDFEKNYVFEKMIKIITAAGEIVIAS